MVAVLPASVQQQDGIVLVLHARLLGEADHTQFERAGRGSQPSAFQQPRSIRSLGDRRYLVSRVQIARQFPILVRRIVRLEQVGQSSAFVGVTVIQMSDRRGDIENCS